MSIFSLLAAVDPAEIGKSACSVGGNTAVGCSTGLLSSGGFVFNVINAVLLIIGALSVIMVIVGGLRYVLSGGDPAGLKSAKDTILYALVGLAVALLAYSIVSFVVTRIV